MNDRPETIILNILSLEDSLLDFEIISEKLIGAGYHFNISRVEKETEFIDSLQRNKYDIILADYNLPNFDAFQALAICNQKCPDIPFICVSGSIGEILAIELLKQGAVDYVLKDRLERLPFAIKRALEDATEKKKRKEAEEALRESEQRLRDIIFSTADWVWEVDENGVFTYSSQRGLELLKASHEEIIGKTPFDFMPPEEAKRVYAIFVELIKNKAPIKDLENWNIGKDGNMICLLTNGVPILNYEGRMIGYRGVDKNITERKLAENAIRQSEAELNYAQDIGNMGSWHHHLPTNQFTSSKNMARLLHREPMDENEQYLAFIDHIHPDDRHLIDDHVEKIISTHAEVSYELRYILDNGEIIWLQNNIRPTFQEGKLTDLHGVMTDITRKKRTELDLIKAKEKAEASDRLKTSFINNISHEIRTPLNGILGFTEVLTYPNLPAEEKEKYLTMLYNSSERLINTITNFLDISLLTTGNQLVFKKEVNPGDIIYKAIEKHKNAAAQKRLTLTMDIPSKEKDIKIVSDNNLLGKILSQLIDNAIKFTPKGTVKVGYRVNHDELHFFVKDLGIGIQEENKQQIFEYFIQENSATTRGYEGSGLGLPIASGFVKLLGGKIWLNSKKDEGSTFYFSIPLEQTSQSSVPMENIQPLKTNHKQTILIAEDDEANFLYISLLLKDDSIDIIHAINGLDAVKLCKDHREIELVLMDLKMPEMDGFEATIQIKSARPELPIIAVSAYTGNEDQQKAFNAGCNDFISKPIKRETLMPLLQEKGMLLA